MSDNYKYRAFISYSHRDSTWGDWLHKTLETYRVPRRLVGRPSRDGTVPPRLYPVFRDRDELPSSASLGDNIDAALRGSRYLIVICSPAAAVSRWVNEEVRAFKALGRDDHILCLLVDGEPNASDDPASGQLECFPPALRFRVTADGAITDQRVEPIAADARAGKDGKANARLKVLAGLLGVGYDDLKQREQQRRFWQRVQLAVLGIALLGVFAGLWAWQEQRKAEQARQALSAEYAEQGRQLLLAGSALQAAVYLSEAYTLDQRSPVLRFLVARAMHSVDALRAARVEKGWIPIPDFSQDGTRVVIAHANQTVDVWDADGGGELFELQSGDHMQVGARYSPDGTRILTTSLVHDLRDGDGRVNLWDARSGKLLYTLKLADEALIGAVFSPDGRRFVTREQGHGGTVKLWDTASGKLLLTLTRGGFMRAGFGHDSTTLVTGDAEDTVTLWDATSGRARIVLRGHRGTVNDCKFSADGTRIVTASADKSAKVWDAQSGKLLATLATDRHNTWDTGHSDEVVSAAFSPDGKRVVTGSKDKTARVWDAANGKMLARLGPMGGEIALVGFTADGERIYMASEDDVIWLWDAHDLTMRGSLPGSRAWISGDGHRLLTVSRIDSLSQVWDVRAASDMLAVQGYGTPAFSQDETRIATVADDQARVWDARTGAQQLALRYPGEAAAGSARGGTSISFSPDGTRLLTVSSFDHSPSLWDAQSGALLAQLVGHTDTVVGAGFSPDGARLYTFSQDGGARFWDGHDGRSLLSVGNQGGRVEELKMSPDGHRFLIVFATERNAAEDDYLVEVRDLVTGKTQATIHVALDRAGTIAYSPDGTRLYTGDRAGRLAVWDAATGAALASWDGGGEPISAIALRPDGAHLVSIARDGTLKCWDVASKTLVWVFKGKSLSFSAVSYSTDGDFLLALGQGRDAAVWDAATGRELMELPGDSTATSVAVFSPSGARIATYGHDEIDTNDVRAIRIWDSHLETRDPAQVARLVRCRLPWTLQGRQLLPTVPDRSACDKG